MPAASPGLQIRAFFVPLLAGATLGDRVAASAGAVTGIIATALITTFVLGGGPFALLLVAPMGASAVLVFALPASPLAQPWPVIGGPAVASAGRLFPIVPVGIYAVLLAVTSVLFHRLTRPTCPHRPAARPVATTEAEPHPEDFDAALAELTKRSTSAGTISIVRPETDHICTPFSHRAARWGRRRDCTGRRACAARTFYPANRPARPRRANMVGFGSSLVAIDLQQGWRDVARRHRTTATPMRRCGAISPQGHFPRARFAVQ